MKSYSEEELLYSATSKCHCGAGLAYPKDSSQPDERSVFKSASDWWCSTLLKGIPWDGKKHDVFSFAIYEIKSEDQPSANGQTTRPK